MREAAFVKSNIEKWKSFEAILSDKMKATPDELASLFIQITDDLAFAQTQYPQSDITTFLNGLALKTHQKIYTNKKENVSRFKSFWWYELPLVYYQNRKILLISFLFFILAFAIGAVSTANDPLFARLILGDEYVNTTLENIDKGDPLAIYKSMTSTPMFFFITFNNIKVSFFVFVGGIAFGLGTVLSLLRNGIMVGVFQYFFYQKNLLATSVLTIWIHGTLEISSIIIAGAAGFVMAKGLLFPKSFPRIFALVKGAKEGMKMVLGLVPIFIMAGFLESFVTRHSEWHWAIKLAIIILSASFIIYYFIIYPNKLYKHGKKNNRILQNS